MHVFLAQVKKIRISQLVFLLSLVFLFNFAALCSTGNNGQQDLGVFKSADFGVNYEQKNALPDGQSLNGVSVLGITIDEFDPEVMYLSARDVGLFRSSNGGEQWERSGLESGTFYNVAIDPKNNRNLYAAGVVDEIGRIYRSSDSGKNWKEVYRETNPGSKVFDVAVDHFDTSKIYAITEKGAVLKSDDNGDSWVVKTFFEGRAIFLRMSKFDSRIIYVSSPDIGIHRTLDGAETWEQVSVDEGDFPGGNKVFDFQFHPSDDNILYIATGYGLLKSEDRGITWESKELLIRPGENSLLRFVIDPINPDNIYLALDNAMYRSRDGGDSWTVKEKITTSQIYALEINPEEPENIYLGIWFRGE